MIASADVPAQPLLLFYSYSSKDELLRQQLDDHLATLKRESVIDTWTFRKIEPGEEWDRKINEKLNDANIILLLISADFLASEYCVGVEVKRALQRHEEGTAIVIPVILRDCDWHTHDFARLQALPSGAKPVTRFRRRDAAWTDVARGIRRAAEIYRERMKKALATLPAAPATKPATAGPPARQMATPAQKGKLLAIEDDPEVQNLYKTYLQKRGYEVVQAFEGNEGIKRFEEHDDVALVILNLNMPAGMSGEEWLHWHLRRFNDIPVIIASGKSDILSLAKETPNTAAITKPFHMEELEELIEVLLAPVWEDAVLRDHKVH